MKQLLPWREQKARNRPLVAIELSGLIALLFVFLFLLMALPQIGYHNPYLSGNLPVLGHPQAIDFEDENTIVVSLTRQGDIFYGSQRVQVESLHDHIRASLNNGLKPRVYINADKRATYAQVSAVLDQIRAAGVTDITIVGGGFFTGLSEVPRPSTTPPPSPSK